MNSRRKDRGGSLLLVNVISEVAKFILDLSEMIMNSLIVTLSVILQPMQVLEKTINVIGDDDARWPLGWCPF